MDDICVAAVVMRSVAGRIKKNIERIKYWTEQASRLGAEIVCFPELSITGYSKIANKSLAISLNDDCLNDLFSVSARTNMIIAPGMIEKGTYEEMYATHVVISPNGKMGVYRKTHIPYVEKEIFTAGNSLPVFQTGKIKIGLQLCYDSHFPELSTIMSQAGVELILIPHASPRGTIIEKHRSWTRHLTARAFDNSLFVVACNQVGNNGENLIFPGNAVAFSPSGKIIGKKLSDGEGILLVHLKTRQIDHVRQHRMRYFFPNRQPDLYKNTSVTIYLNK